MEVSFATVDSVFHVLVSFSYHFSDLFSRVDVPKYNKYYLRWLLFHNLQVSVKDSIHIPIYDVDQSVDPASLSKKFSNFTMGMLPLLHLSLNRELHYCYGILFVAVLFDLDDSTPSFRPSIDVTNILQEVGGTVFQ